jgi:hypothetical protein
MCNQASDSYNYRRAARRLGFGIVVGALAFAISAVLLLLLDALTSSGRYDEFGYALAGVLAVVAAFVLLITGFPRLWLLFLPDRRVVADMYVELIVAFASLTLVVVCIHYLVLFPTLARAQPVREESVGDPGGRAAARSVADEGAELARDDAVWATAEYYLWNFSDAIPVIKLPETVNWELDWTYVDNASGWLLLLYKVLVIVPILAVVARSLKPNQSEST